MTFLEKSEELKISLEKNTIHQPKVFIYGLYVYVCHWIFCHPSLYHYFWTFLCMNLFLFLCRAHPSPLCFPSQRLSRGALWIVLFPSACVGHLFLSNLCPILWNHLTNLGIGPFQGWWVCERVGPFRQIATVPTPSFLLVHHRGVVGSIPLKSSLVRNPQKVRFDPPLIYWLPCVHGRSISPLYTQWMHIF